MFASVFFTQKLQPKEGKINHRTEEAKENTWGKATETVAKQTYKYKEKEKGGGRGIITTKKPNRIINLLEQAAGRSATRDICSCMILLDMINNHVAGDINN